MSRPSSAEDAFARYVALRESGREVEFDDWVRGFPEFERELRSMQRGWSRFERNLDAALGEEKGSSVFHRAGRRTPDAPEQEALAPDRTVGDYRLVERIARGGMGEVWEAEQISLHRRVALKFIRPDRLSARAAAFFQREARAGGRLSHPGIVMILATGESEGVRWLAEELVPGGATLHDFLVEMRGGEGLPGGYHEKLASLFLRITDAIQAAHDAGVIHRDLKPQNVLITPDDRPKVTDFGLARITDEASLSGPLALEGTPAYMSPEQAMAKMGGIDLRTDVFSLGAILYEALTLRRAFEGDTTTALRAVLSSDPPDPRKIRPEVPAELAAIAMKALEKRREERFQSMRELGDELLRYLRSEPIKTEPPGPLRRARKWARRHPTAATGAALGVALLLTGSLLGGRALSAIEDAREQERQRLLAEAWRGIDAGDLMQAETVIRRFEELYPDDPRGALVLAAGFGRNFQTTDFREQLERMNRRGWNPSRDSGATALSLFVQALSAYHERRSAAYPEIEALLERALELDPGFEPAYYPLYFARESLGDHAGARKALSRHRETLRIGDPHARVVAALEARLDGDVGRAVQTLERLRSDIGEEAFGIHRGFRALGRCGIELYLDGGYDAGVLSPAREALERAVADFPLDALSWINLARVHLFERDRAAGIRERAASVAAAHECALRATELSPESAPAWMLLAQACVGRVQAEWDDDAVPMARLAEARAAVQRLQELSPGSESAAAVESDLLYFDGSIALAEGDDEAALELFERSARLDGDQVLARVLYGQLLCHLRDDQPGALASFEEAEAAWDRLSDRAPGHFRGGSPLPSRWLFAIHVWGFGTAGRLGDVDRATSHLDGALDLLDAISGDEQALPDVFNLAEFLAAPGDVELQDCDLVRGLLETFPIEETYAQSQAGMLERVLEACPP